MKLNDGDEITNVNGTNSIGVQKLNGEDGWYLISSIPANNDDLVLNQTVPTYKLKLENAEILDTDKTEFEAGERVRIRPKFDDPEKEFAEWQTWPISYVGIEPNGDGTYTLTMPSSELTLTAHYSMKQYTLTVKNGCIEGIEGLDTGSYEKGVVHKLTANEAAKGKEFDKWELSDGLEIVEGDETSETISVKMPGKDATATATYKDKTVTPDPDPKPDPDPDPTDPDQPDPNPDEKNTYTLTVEGGLLNGKSAADGVEVKAGDKITVTVDDAEIPQSMAFNGWNVPTELIDAVNKEIAPNILDTNANTLEFTMPDSLTNGGEYTIRALYCPDEIAEERPAISSGLSTAAVVAVGGAAAGVAVWQGVSLGVDAYLANALPKGVAVPTNRRELVVLLWQTAGKPEVELPALYSDISAEEIELQKASRWAVANGLVKDADKNDASRFDPDHYVTKMDVFGAWLKLKKLMKK